MSAPRECRTLGHDFGKPVRICSRCGTTVTTGPDGGKVFRYGLGFDERPAYGTPGYHRAIDEWVERHTLASDRQANGRVRCECGCKYWVEGKCFDCGSSMPRVKAQS